MKHHAGQTTTMKKKAEVQETKTTNYLFDRHKLEAKYRSNMTAVL